MPNRKSESKSSSVKSPTTSQPIGLSHYKHWKKVGPRKVAITVDTISETDLLKKVNEKLTRQKKK